MTTSKTAIFRGSDKPLEIRQCPLPELQAQEILVRNEMTTLCRSDLNTFAGKRIEPTPTILGHEIIGRIARFGPGVTPVDLRGQPLQVGDRITWAIFASHPGDPMSLRGMPQKAADRFKYGHELLTEHSSLHGGLSEHTILRPHTPILKMSMEVPVSVAATVNCAMATVAGALRVAGEICAKRVLVSGAGMLGIIACAMASRTGAARVAAMDIDSGRLEIARKFGADTLIQATLDSENTATSETMNRFDVVIEVSGAATAMERTLDMLDIGGVAVWIGATYPARRTEISAEQVVRNLITIRGLHNYNTDDFRTAVEFVEQHHQDIPFQDLIHDGFTLDEAQQAFEYGLRENPFRVGIHL
jgi:putative phosphonate catabolism associated alcohol dehydrogenase